MHETRYIIAGNFIDGSGAARRRNVFLAMRDGVITALGSAADLADPERAACADFSHGTILPALVDGSVSLSRSPSVDPAVRNAAAGADQAERSTMLSRHLRDCYSHGVLGVADSDDPSALLQDYRAGENGPIAIRTSGLLCRSMADWRAGQGREVDFLKIAYSPHIEENAPPGPGLTAEELGLVLRARGGKKAVVVANGRREVATALAAGCEAIEEGYGMGEENLRAMAEGQILWLPSLLRAKNALDGASGGGAVCCRFSQRYVAPGKPLPGAEALWKKTLTEQMAQLRRGRELGVPTAVGSGAGSSGILPGEAMVEEMKLFLKAGYTLEETVHRASEINARFFALEGLGRLAVGRPATFLLARGTVQQLPRKLAYLEGIYVNGLPSGAYRKNPFRAGA